RRSYPPRPRRACRGELVQIDGSEHAWFEDRGPVCTLLVYVDDDDSRRARAIRATGGSTAVLFSLRAVARRPPRSRSPRRLRRRARGALASRDARVRLLDPG